jgi:hypothetical protein
MVFGFSASGLKSEHRSEQNHWSECGRATSIASSDALGRPHRSLPAFGIMKRVRTKIWFVLAALVAIGLVLVWAEVHRPTASGKEWILLSAPSVRSRTNSGAAMPVVTFRVSNVGPR